MPITVYAEGVDYSTTPHDDWDVLAGALRAEGKRFAGRYAVYDKAPGGRGITAEEYRALTAHKIDTFLYYEETEAWMRGGWSAGVRAATRALDNIQQAEMPEGMPVNYSHDIDPEPGDFEAIDDCLRGCASVVGIDRVGFYGGFAGIDHVHAAGTAKWFVQPIAWQYGHGIHPAAHLHQYNTGQPNTIFIGGINVDLVAALKPHYGQASDYVAHATTTTTPPPVPVPQVPPKMPKGMSTGLANRLFNPRHVIHPETKEVLTFQRGARISEAWLLHVLSTNPKGKGWWDYKWVAIESITERGDGRIVVQFSDGWTWERPARSA